MNRVAFKILLHDKAKYVALSWESPLRPCLSVSSQRFSIR